MAVALGYGTETDRNNPASGKIVAEIQIVDGRPMRDLNPGVRQ